MTIREKIDASSGRYPFYLILFCLTLPLSYFEVNSAFFEPYGIVPAVAVLLVLTLLVFAITRSLLRNTPAAGLAALIVLVLLTPGASLTTPVYPMICVAGIGFVIFRIVKRKQTLRAAIDLPPTFTKILNTTAAMILIATGIQIAYDNHQVAGNAEAMTARASGNIPEGAAPAGPLPNVVHIVLDGYSRADVLQSGYGFDNTPFLNALRQRGFRVADKASAPFNQTLLSMSSIFLLEPFTDVMASPVSEQNRSILRRTLARSQRDGSVVRKFRRLGYRLVSTPSTYPPMQWEQISGNGGAADVLERVRLPGTYALAYRILEYVPAVDTVVRTLFGKSFDIATINYRILREVPNRRFQPSGERPLFVYEHIVAPHPPFNIDRNGEQRPITGMPEGLGDGMYFTQNDDDMRRRYREGYVEKLRYVNDAILTQIDAIKETFTGPLIIVLHGDHGGGLYYNEDSMADTCLNERYSPLLAVYASDPALSAEFAKEFAGDFNLVNIYRVIFRRLLDIDLPSLPSPSGFVSWDIKQSFVLKAGDRDVVCTAPRRIWTAERPSGAKPDAAPNAVSR